MEEKKEDEEEEDFVFSFCCRERRLLRIAADPQLAIEASIHSCKNIIEYTYLVITNRPLARNTHKHIYLRRRVHAHRSSAL